jgi:hypothetical protein
MRSSGIPLTVTSKKLQKVARYLGTYGSERVKQAVFLAA